MAKKLSKSQRAVMIWLSRGWKAYVAYGNRVEVNGKPVCTTETMAVLEKAGLIEREGVAAWTATPAGREWRDPPAAA
ncbi:hypothetical protein D0B54_08410 [Solimonas sp. K1W22B-7]|uniref:hypothetical protein n=1 Tax=Solimonas sp. K1W22B-7 TaxID=2303331 RepID=UPI000E33774A|nr:hypothetical protein [Solimonas sp. K1W22B-7]AXQ28700.1 hypothetical protein D0B54_08410 [Solimonas sp. K1W22B-7]